MKAWQRQFIEFALNKGVLKFGEFTLKSGRKSPYFFNAGLFNTGRDLALLGRFYLLELINALCLGETQRSQELFDRLRSYYSQCHLVGGIVFIVKLDQFFAKVQSQALRFI